MVMSFASMPQATKIAGAHSGVPETQAARGQVGVAAFPAQAGSVRYFKTGARAAAHGRVWDEVAEGEHLRNAEQYNFIEHPRQPLAPGLVPPRMRALERK